MEGLEIVTFIFSSMKNFKFKLIWQPVRPAHQTALYRPISLLPIKSKVLTTIIRRRLNH